MPLKPPIRETLLSALIGISFFIALPVLVTAMIPVSWIALNRDANSQVNASAYTCVLFVLPWQVQRVANVTVVESHTVRADRVVRQKSHGRDQGHVHSDGVDALMMSGPSAALTVAISPASSTAVKAEVQAFLQDQSQRQTYLFVIPNWKFGLGTGLPLTLAAWLYILGSLLAGLRAVYRSIRHASRRDGSP
jgi:hypothetical protein